MQTFAMLVGSEPATFGLAGNVAFTKDETPTVDVWRGADPGPEDVHEFGVRELTHNRVRRVVAAALQRFPSGNGHPL